GNMQVAEKSELQLDQRVCPNCGESCEKEHETVFVNGQEFCVCCNSSIETCYTEEGSTKDFHSDSIKSDNAFAEFFDERRYLNPE
ncbi:MAG: hypothetical protein QF779_02790, partial [SAR324 cluster bacterium]|nr:hypothetical protein [SAR324 cluster bacterium]